MRKVKVLAFVLAALMVVAAFAGCGTKQLKTDVSTLDERVTALEELLKQVNSTVNNAATAGQIEELLEAITANKAEAAAGDKALADAIAKITADQTAANDKLKTDLEKLVNDVKADQKTGDTALQVAIEKLTNSLADTNKALADSVADLLDEIKDGDEDLTDAIADTNKALADAIAAINKAQDAQGKDVADALAATNKALEDAMKALQESTKANDDAIREDLRDAIDAITAAQNKQGEDLTKALEESNKALSDALKELQDSTKANDDAIRADLTAAIEAITAAQNKQGEDLAAALKETNDALKETNDALTAAIESLKDEIKTGDDAVRAELMALIEALAKTQEDQNNAVMDALEKLAEKMDKENQDTSALNTAKNNYTGKLEVLKSQLDAKSNLYSTDEYTTIAVALVAGVANIKNATTVEDVIKYHDEAKAVYDACTPLSVQLESAYVALLGNVTDKSEADVKAYKKLADAAKKLYGASGEEIIIGEDDDAVNLIDAYTTFNNAYEEAVDLKETATEIDKNIKKIAKVYVVEGAYYAGQTPSKYNLKALADVTKAYTDYANTITKGAYKDVFNKQAMLDLVTRKAELDGYNADKTRLQTAIANYVFYGELEGTKYLDVFNEYDTVLAGNEADTVDWFKQVAAIYDVVDERVEEWADEYDVDNENLVAIINAFKTDATYYATYLKNNDYAHRYLAKYDTFVSTYKKRIENLNKIEKFTDADVDELVALDEALFDSKTGWVVTVVEDATADKTAVKRNLLTEETEQLEAMYQKALKRTTLFAFEPGSPAETFYKETFDQAKAVAAKLNTEIDKLVKAKATALSVFDYKIRNNFVEGTKGGYVADTAKYEEKDLFVDITATNKKVVDDISIYMFEKVYVTKDYDLSELVHKSDLLSAEAVVAARVAALKVTTDKINDSHKAVVKSIKGENIENVSLTHEADVNNVWKIYTDLSAAGFQPNETKDWVKNSKTNEYESVLLLTDDVIYDLTYLKASINTLRTFANNLVNTFKTLHEANSNYAFSIPNGKSTVAKVKNVPEYDAAAKKNVDHFYYITALNTTDGAVTVTKDASTSSLMQDVAVKNAYAAYQNFLAANSKSAADGKVTTDAAVEKAIRDYKFEDIKLIVVKMYAYAEIERIDYTMATTNGGTWDDSVNQDFDTHKNLQKEIIIAAVDKNAIAVNLKHFHDLTSVDYLGFTLFGDTFGANGLIK